MTALALYSTSVPVLAAQAIALEAFGLDPWQEPIDTSGSRNRTTIRVLAEGYTAAVQEIEQYDPSFYRLVGLVLRDLDPQFRDYYSFYGDRCDGGGGVKAVLSAMRLQLALSTYNADMSKAGGSGISVSYVDDAWNDHAKSIQERRQCCYDALLAMLKLMKDFRSWIGYAEEGHCRMEWSTAERYEQLFSYMAALHPMVATSRLTLQDERGQHEEPPMIVLPVLTIAFPSESGEE